MTDPVEKNEPDIIGTTKDGVDILSPSVSSENFTREEVQAAIAKAGFTFGDIIENGWAGEGNPHKRGIYLWSFKRMSRINRGKFVRLLFDDGKTGDLPIDADDKLTKVGTIFDKHVESLKAENAALLSRVERLETDPAEVELQTVDPARLAEALKLMPQVMRASLAETIVSAINEQAAIIARFKRTANARRLSYEAARLALKETTDE